MKFLNNLPQVNMVKASIFLGIIVFGAVMFFFIKGLAGDIKKTSNEAGQLEVKNEVLENSNEELSKAIKAATPDLRRDYCRCVRYNAEPASCKQLLPADVSDDIQCSIRQN